jgi:hypothetical protein
MSYLPQQQSSYFDKLKEGLYTINDEIGKAAETVKKTATDAVSSVTGKPSPGPYGVPPSGVPPSGGKKRRSRGKRGGYSANTPLNNIASSASPYKGVETAQPHNWVGGKSKRGGRRRKTRRTRRNRRSRRMRR